MRRGFHTFHTRDVRNAFDISLLGLPEDHRKMSEEELRESRSCRLLEVLAVIHSCQADVLSPDIVVNRVLSRVSFQHSNCLTLYLPNCAISGLGTDCPDSNNASNTHT